MIMKVRRGSTVMKVVLKQCWQTSRESVTTARKPGTEQDNARTRKVAQETRTVRKLGQLRMLTTRMQHAHTARKRDTEKKTAGGIILIRYRSGPRNFGARVIAVRRTRLLQQRSWSAQLKQNTSRNLQSVKKWMSVSAWMFQERRSCQKHSRQS